jgi:hypothetical protein
VVGIVEQLTARLVPLQHQRLLVIASYADINIAIEISDEAKVNRPATNLTIFNVGLARFGLIDQHVEILAAVRAFDIFLEQLQFLLPHTELNILKCDTRICDIV